jgi:ubiquinone/menaquinone biosynthesis C-methylase UbiE
MGIMKQVNYDEISKVYDDVREGDVVLINQFLKELPSRDGLNVLDIGCGTGNYTDIFQRATREHSYSFHGIDPSDGMLNKARQKNGFITYQAGTAEKIPSQADFFDFVYMTDVIHHVPDIDRMFTEIFRVLKPGGKVCIVTQSHEQIEHRPIARFFPETVRVDKGRYPDILVIINAAQHNRLHYLKKEILFDSEEVELGTYFLELVRKKGYSMLHLLTEHEYQIGMRALEDALRNGPIKSEAAGETLIWFTKE